MNSSFLYTTLALSIAGGLVFWLKGIPAKIISKIKQSIIYSVKIYQYDELFDMIEDWLQSNYKSKYKEVEAFVQANNYGPIGVGPARENTYDEIRYRQEDSTFVIKYGGKKLLITNKKEKLEKAASIKDAFCRHYTIIGFLAKSQISDLLKEILEKYNKKRNKSSIRVYSNSKYGDWILANDTPVKQMASIVLPNSTKENVIQDIEDFINSKEWYNRIGIPYKRGYCFYGPPGNGKTSFSLAIASYFKKNVYCLSINSLESDNELQRAFNGIEANSILLIEDIDKAYSGRESLNHNVSFSALLNLLDGALYRFGLISIITTNYFEKLDSALIRSGRCDVKVEISNPTKREIRQYIKLFYNEDVDVEIDVDLSMSELQEICIRNKDSVRATLDSLINRKLKAA